jgi:hypothetical protein
MEVFLDTGPRQGRPSRRFPPPRPAVPHKADPPAFYRAALRAAVSSASLVVAYILLRR